ncbi:MULTISPECIES: DUF397 domain-containing protein [Streptomyces]|uniref:DUF397 domain-containing protein n=1 Tax=Streptomyces TaxID=1883 RepID=UPI00081B9D14|nr:MULTISPECIES: DUF397 domain-containing protein [Streptomyces]MYX86461.1 DUF397 domain-containing protein [Streptomyces sp. SID4915]WJK69552.1 DUF397 domain-containing protein [Streptomyces albidoflavus]WSD40719.1 DUF397 domain-containing protein [Streptomyces albidoflavus]SCD88115.1 protein of unknown function [Streptomyces sp. BvitLS-983]
MHITTHAALSDAHWFTSSYSNAQGGECVEGAVLDCGQMAIRDTKDRQRGAFVFPAPAWRAFLGAVKEGGESV